MEERGAPEAGDEGRGAEERGRGAVGGAGYGGELDGCFGGGGDAFAEVVEGRGCVVEAALFGKPAGAGSLVLVDFFHFAGDLCGWRLRLGRKGEARGERQGGDQLEEDRDAPAVEVSHRARPEGHAVADPFRVSCAPWSRG